MGWQTTEALIERKLDSWRRKKVITNQQFKDIVFVCETRGFWDALGMATRLKYRNLRLAGHIQRLAGKPKPA